MRLNKEINSAIATADVQKRFQELVIVPQTGTPQDLQKVYEDDVMRWRQIITDAKVELK
jgi:tripartite-type tricarboxylate transporter receptor subunit TctC